MEYSTLFYFYALCILSSRFTEKTILLVCDDVFMPMGKEHHQHLKDTCKEGESAKRTPGI